MNVVLPLGGEVGLGGDAEMVWSESDDLSFTVRVSVAERVYPFSVLAQACVASRECLCLGATCVLACDVFVKSRRKCARRESFPAEVHFISGNNESSLRIGSE